MSPAAANTGKPFPGNGLTGGVPATPTAAGGAGGGRLFGKHDPQAHDAASCPSCERDFGSVTFSTPFDAALRITDSLSANLLLPTVSDALLMSAGRDLLQLELDRRGLLARRGDRAGGAERRSRRTPST